MNVEYWTWRRDNLLQKHRDAEPNQKEFWFSNIVDELNEYQKQIERRVNGHYTRDSKNT